MSVLTVLPLALTHGAILSLCLTVVLVLSLAINAEMWVNDYPPDIRAQVGEMSAKSKKQRIPAAIAFLGINLIILFLGAGRVLHLFENGVFVALWSYAFVTLWIFNLYDLLVLDWLFFVTIRPKFVIIPGTEGFAGYKNYFFHFRGFLIGHGYCALFALIVAVLGLLAKKLFGL